MTIEQTPVLCDRCGCQIHEGQSLCSECVDILDEQMREIERASPKVNSAYLFRATAEAIYPVLFGAQSLDRRGPRKGNGPYKKRKKGKSR